MKYCISIIVYEFLTTFSYSSISYESYMTRSCVIIQVHCVLFKSSIAITIDSTWKLSWVNTFETVISVVVRKLQTIATIIFSYLFLCSSKDGKTYSWISSLIFSIFTITTRFASWLINSWKSVIMLSVLLKMKTRSSKSLSKFSFNTFFELMIFLRQ